LVDSTENLELMTTLLYGKGVDIDLQGRKRVDLAFYFEPELAHYPLNPESLAKLDVTAAPMSGTLYPAQGDLPAMFLRTPGPREDRSEIHPKRVPDSAAKILERHGILVRQPTLE
jgi:hypothetical protein